MADKVDATRHVLTMDDVMAADDKEYTEIPGFKPGQLFRIQSLTAGDLISWSEANDGEAKRTAGLRLIVQSLVDESGALICSDKDIAVWRRKSHKVTERIVKEILKLNGMNVTQDTAKKD